MLSEKEVSNYKEKLREIFTDYYEKAGGKDFRYYHLCRVWRYSKNLMQTDEIKKYDFDHEVVEIAALFHDIGRSLDIEDDYLNPMKTHEGHAKKGKNLLDKTIDEVSKEKLELAKQVIGNHHSSPETVEGKIVQDADKLTKFGVLNIWRLVHFASDEERTLEETLDYFWNTAAENSEEKLDDLHFNISKKVASDRFEKYKEAIKQIEKENEGSDII